MKIPAEIAEQVITGSMEDLWKTFINLEGEYPEYEEDYLAVRFGIEIPFEIYELWETDTERIDYGEGGILVKKGKVNINGKIYKHEELRSEKEERRKIMVKAIIENMGNKSVIQPRGN